MTLSQREQAALAAIAGRLAVPVQWLSNLIRHESGFNPQAANPASSAKGLIQFTNSTAQKLGYKDSSDLIKKNPTIEKQLLGPVHSYLSAMAPFPSEQSLYLAVFYPAARSWDVTRQFPAEVQRANPGIQTPQDYINRVQGKAGAAIGGAVLALAIGAAVFYYLSRGKK